MVRQGFRDSNWDFSGTKRSPEGHWKVTGRAIRGHRTSANNFGELGAILAEVMLCRGRPSEHNLGELGANLAEVMVGVAHFWDRLGVTLGGLRGGQ